MKDQLHKEIELAAEETLEKLKDIKNRFDITMTEAILIFKSYFNEKTHL